MCYVLCVICYMCSAPIYVCMGIGREAPSGGSGGPCPLRRGVWGVFAPPRQQGGLGRSRLCPARWDFARPDGTLPGQISKIPRWDFARPPVLMRKQLKSSLKASLNRTHTYTLQQSIKKRKPSNLAGQSLALDIIVTSKIKTMFKNITR